MRYNFCPDCGRRYSAGGPPFHCKECNQTLYLNSKPTSSTLIIDGHLLLLGKRRIEPSRRKWDVIGGFLNYGEHPYDGAKREAKEETGLDVEIVDDLGIFMDVYGDGQEATLNMCFVARVVSGSMEANDDIEELRWFSVDEIPEDIAFENGKRMIEAWRAYHAG